jgi:hypothetical protein
MGNDFVGNVELITFAIKFFEHISFRLNDADNTAFHLLKTKNANTGTH